MELVYQYMAIFFNFQTTLDHLYPLQVENCDSNSRLVVDEDDNGKSMLERFNVGGVGRPIQRHACVTLATLTGVGRNVHILIQ